jgi:type III secretory pathway component EscV
VSVVGALLFLLLIVFLLTWCNFFKRKRPAQGEENTEKMDWNQPQSHTDNEQAAVNQQSPEVQPMIAQNESSQ